MQSLNINKTSLTPQVSFQPTGDLLIKGISTPEDVHEFYKPIFNWLNEYKETKPKTVNLVLEMDYINSSSSKTLVRLLILVRSMKMEDTTLSIIWRYEENDEDMLDLGKDFQLSSQSQITFVSIKKN